MLQKNDQVKAFFKIFNFWPEMSLSVQGHLKFEKSFYK